MTESEQILSYQNIGIIITIITAIGSFTGYIYKKVVVPILDLMEGHKKITESLDVIKKEVVTNGGKSLKDVVNSLKDTCERIEITQKVLEQRSKLALNYHNEALFETDRRGNLVWTNEKFYQLTGENHTNLEGLNWINYVQEGDRDKFQQELKSCLETCRKFEIETKSTEGAPIKIVGYPYKVGRYQLGFLFNLSFIGVLA